MNFFPRPKKKPNKEIEFEEIFLDKLLREKEAEDEVLSKRLEAPVGKLNFFILLLLGVFLISLLLFFSFKLQIRESNKYRLLAQENKYLTLHLSSERGMIYDRNMHQLAFNEVNFDLVVEKSQLPSDLKKREDLLKEIAVIFDENINELREKIEKENKDQDEILLKRNIDHRSLILFEANSQELPGFKIRKRIIRNYEGPKSLSHIVGYLGKISSEELKQYQGYEIGDYIGKEGAERTYEEVLREKKGEIQIERTAEGKEVSKKIVKFPQSGSNLVLTLDFSLQKKAEEVLRNVLKEVGSEKGALVALDPRNGEILALVSLPAFDNNLFARGVTFEEFQKINQDPLKPQLNRVIGGVYLTGSTIKPLIGVAALEEDIITENTKLYCPLELCLEHKYTGEPECYGDWTFHGWTDIRRAIAESVNPFFYIIGGGYTAPPSSSIFFDPRLPRKFKGLGVTKIGEYLRLFGLGEKTGIDLPGEVVGRVPTPEWKEKYFSDRPREQQIWYLGDTYNLSIGQGYLLATPLQIATAFQAIANGGKIYRPKIAKKILDPDNNLKKELKPEILKENFVMEKSLQIVREGMLRAVTSPAGSAHSLSSLPVSVAAKTGTAQIYPKKEIYHNWVTVFAPYENPEILLTVVIEEVKGTRIAAQKVAKEILDWYFSADKIQNTFDNDVSI